MRIPSELEGARLSVARAATLVSMDPGHFRRLIRRGVFPAPKRTPKGMPFFDFDLLTQIGEVLKSGIGLSGEEISFYRRVPKQARDRSRASRPTRQHSFERDDYILNLLEGCRQLGIDNSVLNEASVRSALAAEFGDDRPALERALQAVVRRLTGT